MGVFSHCLSFYSLGVVLLVICNIARAEDHFYDFVLKESNFTRMCSTKSMLVVNDSFPGPVITLRKGDTVFINVHNEGEYGLTIHWHGVKQPRNPWSDGPNHITQCKIESGTNFTYKVIFSTEEGTLWWHAHSDWTQSSVHGAIVILPAEGTSYPFPEPDGDEVLILASWYKADLPAVLEVDLSVGADLPRADSYVINGYPGASFECDEEAYRFFVEYGKTYLLRLINAAVNSELFFAIGGHNFTVVGMDGNYLKPFSTSRVVISPGQTMNILLTADQTPSLYFVAAKQFVTVGDADIENATVAIMEYIGDYDPPSSPVFPVSLPDKRDITIGNGFLSELKSLASEDHPVNVPLEITTHMYIDASQKEMECPHGCPTLDGKKISSALNNITFQNPTRDILLAYYRNLTDVYTDDFPDRPEHVFNFTGYNLTTANYTTPSIGTRVKMLDYNETVEIVFQGTNVLEGAVNHPMHLHGYSFYVVGSGIGNFDNDTDPKSYNLVDPPELNTIRVPKKGWVTVRFQANNPGVWLWHCHLTKHLTWGMKTAFIVRDGGTPETSMLDPPPSMPRCSKSFRHYIQDYDHSFEMSIY
ncbi:laccase-2-like [Cornus florida]|uniref:laccase-2-like n=1 Tax=Cornus florida TaxID=4283 RepID=UPI0028A0B200|nr:laccase-2-like [Cornus florida]